jgi:S-adenosylmethionine decarboxylase
MIVGTEWLIEATGCDKSALRDEAIIRAVFSSAISDLGLKVLGSVWHKFEGEGGITGLVALTESHLACHTYPEHGTATFNLYCCHTRPEWDWEANLKSALNASTVTVSKIERGEIEAEAKTLEFKFREENSESTAELTDLEIESETPYLKSEIAGGSRQ